MLCHYCTWIDTNSTFDKKKIKKEVVLVILHFKHTYTLCLLFKVMSAFALGKLKSSFLGDWCRSLNMVCYRMKPCHETDGYIGFFRRKS